jgi:hypothetical protein
MMYLVAYALNPARVPPTDLITQLHAPREWWHYIDHTWILSTSESVNEVHNRLIKTLTTADRLLVVQVTAVATSQGWLPEEAWDWINARRYQ